MSNTSVFLKIVCNLLKMSTGNNRSVSPLLSCFWKPRRSPRFDLEPIIRGSMILYPLDSRDLIWIPNPLTGGYLKVPKNCGGNSHFQVGLTQGFIDSKAFAAGIGLDYLTRGFEAWIIEYVNDRAPSWKLQYGKCIGAQCRKSFTSLDDVHNCRYVTLEDISRKLMKRCM